LAFCAFLAANISSRECIRHPDRGQRSAAAFF
jgi:hypothetical protein